VYQDLFGEGIFTGKGIYEVDVFRKVLGKRFPSNAILSHDLIEGSYARTALLSDVEIIDDYPSHFRAHSRRKHRWIRGDWQILRWLFRECRILKEPHKESAEICFTLEDSGQFAAQRYGNSDVRTLASFLVFFARTCFVLDGSYGRVDARAALHAINILACSGSKIPGTHFRM